MIVLDFIAFIFSISLLAIILWKGLKSEIARNKAYVAKDERQRELYEKLIAYLDASEVSDG